MLGRVSTSYRQHRFPLPGGLTALALQPKRSSTQRTLSCTPCVLSNSATVHAAVPKPPSSPNPQRPTQTSQQARASGQNDLNVGATQAVASRKAQSGVKAKQHKGPSDDAPSRELLTLVDGLSTHYAPRRTIEEHPSIVPYIENPDKVRRTATFMAGSDRPHRALRLLTLAKVLGIKPHQNAYENVSHRYAEDERWSMVISVVQLAKRHLQRMSARLLNWKLRAYIETRHYAEVDGTLEEFQQEGLKPSRRTYHLLVSAHLRNHNVVKARQCLQWMHDAGFPVDASTHAQVVSVYRTLGPDEFVANRAFEALRDIGQRSAAVTLNGLIQLCLDAGDTTGALRLFSLFEHPDAPSSIDPVLSAADEETEDHHETPFSTRLFTATLSKSPHAQPDTASFTMLIEHMTRLGDLQRALLTLKQMETVGVVPDLRIAAAVVRAQFAGGDAEGAVALVATICVASATPPTPFLRLGAPRKLEARHRLIPTITRPDAQLFNALLGGVLRLHGLNSMVTILRLMHANKIIPNEGTIEVFLSYVVHNQRPRPRELLRVLRALLSTKARPTLKHYHAIMSAIMREERVVVRGCGWDATAVRFSRKRHRQETVHSSEGRVSTVSRNFHPTAGVRFARKLSYRSLFRPILQKLSATGVRADRATLALRMKHDATIKGDLEGARQRFQDMLAAGMHPNEYHFAALMEGATLAGNMPAALNAFDAARKAGIEPNLVMYTILIAGYARNGEPEPALRLFQRMVKSGLAPDVAVVDALCSAYFTVGAYGVARRTLLQLWPHVKLVPPAVAEIPLRKLAQIFRSGDASEHGHKPFPKRLSKQQQRMLRWKLRKVLAVWKSVSSQRRKVRSVQRRGRVVMVEHLDESV